MPQKPTLSKLLQNAISSYLIDVHTALPAKIESYKNGKAEVTLCLQRKVNDELITLPKLVDVPVMFPRTNGGKSFLSMPIKKGDTGLVIFTERSIDRWKVGGGIVDPKDTRKFDLSDAVFIAGLYDFSKPLNYSNSEAIELVNDKASIILHPDGKIEFKGVSEDLVKIVESVIDNLISAKVVTALGLSPFAPDTIINFNKNKAQISTLSK